MERVLVVLLLAPSFAFAQDGVDDDVVARIREEGFQRSQVMETIEYMTDVLGPRVTGSRDMRRAQAWASSHMEAMGLSNVVVEAFGEHGASWDNDYTSLHLLEPDYQPLIGYPYAFTPGTDGKVESGAAIAIIRDRSDFEKFKGKLRGVVVLSSLPRPLPPSFEADAHRFTASELSEMEGSTRASEFGIGQTEFDWDDRVQSFVPRRDPEDRGLLEPSPEERDRFIDDVQRFYKEEGVVAILDPAPGRDGTVFVAGRPGSRYDRSYEGVFSAPPRVALAAEHYNRLYRLVKREIPVRLELEVRNTVTAGARAANVLGDFPGTDLADEVVIVGGHFDSWHAGTGATDDGAGCAVALEAVRILQAIGVRPRRTIRVALWSWEEGGKVGSRRYVSEHFGSKESGTTATHDEFSAYFGMDNGTGQFRGVYLQGNEHVRPLFEAWMEPFRALGMTTLTSDDAYGVDVVGFDMMGLPAFQFIQDSLDYGSRTHHSNLDVYDRLVPEDLRKNAVILASFLYHAAMRDAPLPREGR